jgi:hypothetical protein
MVQIKEPFIINNFFPENRYKLLMSNINIINRSDWEFDPEYSRYLYQSEYLNRLSLLNLDKAREQFDSPTLLYTYSLLSLYNQDTSSLSKHKDNNACTYTFDICLYSEKPWPIIVEDKEYILYNNDALLFYGEDQWHERPKIEQGNKVLMLFMHYAEPDHPFFQDAKVI